MRLLQRLRESASAPLQFPWPMLVASVFTVLSLLMTHEVIRDEGIGHLVFALTSALPWLVGITLAVRAGNFKRSREHLLCILAVVASIAIICTGTWSYYPPAMIHLAGYLYLAVAPYAQRRHVQLTPPCHYQLSVVVGLLFTGFSVLIFCLGIDAILASLDYLFGVDIESRLYFDVWIVGGGLLGVAWFTSSIRDAYRPAAHAGYPRWAHFIVTYLLVPIIAAYLLILYAYAGKVLFITGLPKGQLAWMICMFAIIGVVTHYIATPLAAEGKSVLRYVARWFYPALILPVLLLWYAIYTRVSAYGVTEERYLLVAGALYFSLLIAGHLTRPQRMWLVTPLLASGILVAASFGPWGANAVSTRSQLHELRALLEEAGVLADGQLTAVPAEPRNVPVPLQSRISNIVGYFVNTEKTEALEPLMAAKPANQDRWEMPRMILQQWGLTPLNAHRNEDGDLRFNYNNDENDRAVEVAGYDIYVMRDNVWLRPDKPTQKIINDTDGQPILTVSIDATTLSVSEPEGRTVTFDLAALSETLVKKLGNTPLTPETRPLLTLVGEKDGLRVKLDISRLNVTMKGDMIELHNLNYSIAVAF